MNNGKEKLSVDKFLEALDNYIASEGIRTCAVNPEAEKAMNLTIKEMRSLNHQQCYEYAYVLYQYCNYCQSIFNKHNAKLKWADHHIGKMIAKMSDRFSDKYLKWEQKVHTIAQLDSFAEKLVEVKMSAEGKVTWLSDKVKDMRKQSDVLFEMAKSKRFNK